MSQTNITFRYTETQDFQIPLEVIMSVPERSIDEMCEYFQRFLSACGYVFEEGERITVTPRDLGLPKAGADVITFNGDSSPFVYGFGDGNNMNCYGVSGGMAEDLINLE